MGSWAQRPDGGFPNDPPQPFTLTLQIDRNSGAGVAILSAPPWAAPLQTNFNLQDILPSSVPAIAAVGTAIANRTAYDEIVSVCVQSFQIYATKGSGLNAKG